MTNQMTPKQVPQNTAAFEEGESFGEELKAVGANVAMAFFEAGRRSTLVAMKADAATNQTQLKTAFYDGFVMGYWVDVTDKQKSGPYA